MSLKLRLKPHEKIVISGAVLVNGPKVAEFLVENNVPILREGDVLVESQVSSPAKRLYFCVQLMYIDVGHIERYRELFDELSTDIIAAAPSTGPFLVDINAKVQSGDYYQALKLSRRLIDYEETLLDGALGKPGILADVSPDNPF